MAEYVIMPKLGFNMEKGTVVKWLVREGDLVKEQDEILEIETDKTVMPVEAQTSGILRKILVAEGEEVPVTLPIAIIAGKDEDISKMIDEAYQKLGKTEVVEKEESKVDRKVSPVIEKSQEIDVISYYQNHQVKVSPVAQKIAEKVGVDLGTIKGTGIGGKKMKRDLQEILTKGEEVNKTEKRISYTGMRKIIGDRLSQSKFTAPHIYFTTSVDISRIIALLKRFNQDLEERISINDFLVFVAARVLVEQPNINCSLLGEEIVYHKDINIGVAVALEEGLIVPVMKNADKKSLSVLSKEIKKLIRLARERKLMPEDYNGGTFTISNLGMYGVDNFTAIINPPEAAILTVGTAKRVPVVIEEKGAEKIEVRSLIEATLSVDHRLIDGAKAANFLKRLKHYLEFPESLVLC